MGAESMQMHLGINGAYHAERVWVWIRGQGCGGERM